MTFGDNDLWRKCPWGQRASNGNRGATNRSWWATEGDKKGQRGVKSEIRATEGNKKGQRGVKSELWATEGARRGQRGYKSKLMGDRGQQN
jgi:hypothetical protein